MLYQKVISLFFLFLLILISGHNALIHDHHGEKVVLDEPSIHYHHSGDHHHQHGTVTFWDWLQGLMDDFEHSDLGEQHFEVYLQPSNVVLISPTTHLEFVHLYGTNHQNLQIVHVPDQSGLVPVREPTCSDPPCLAFLFDRGPPQIS